MTGMTGGKAAVEALRAEGIGHVFGLIGSAARRCQETLEEVHCAGPR